VLEWSYNTDSFIGHERWCALLKGGVAGTPASDRSAGRRCAASVPVGTCSARRQFLPMLHAALDRGRLQACCRDHFLQLRACACRAGYRAGEVLFGDAGAPCCT
jgi:hypothetical protein